MQVSTDPRGWTLGAPKSNASRRTIRPDSVLPGTLAYFMAEKGIPAVNAAAYLGHTTAVFMDIYLRHKVEGLAAAEDALGAVFASARGA